MWLIKYKVKLKGKKTSIVFSVLNQQSQRAPSTSILRCVIPVVLSNNKNKLMVHTYIVKNTTIFLIVRLLLLRYNYMFWPSMLVIFRLYMKHLTISYIYM